MSEYSGEYAQQSEEEWFEREFEKRDKIEIRGQEVEVLDISPRELKHETPVLYIGGYGDGSPEGRKANASELVKQGRRVLMIKSPHGVESEPGTDENKLEDGMRESLLNQVNAIIPVLEKKRIEKISAIGESRGGAVAVLTAYLYPEKFDNLVLVDPAGMVSEMSSAELVIKFIYAGLVEAKAFNRGIKAGQVSKMAQDQVTEGTKMFTKWILSNPKASKDEIVDIAKAEVVQLLSSIKKSGVGISIIHGVDDKVFDIEAVQHAIQTEIAIARGGEEFVPGSEEELLNVEKVIDGFYSIKGGHGGINTNPEQYSAAAEAAIVALENKKKAVAEKH